MHTLLFVPRKWQNLEKKAWDRKFQEIPEWRGNLEKVQVGDKFISAFMEHCIMGKDDPVTSAIELFFFWFQQQPL